MKKLAVADVGACMACKTCEIACAQAFHKKEYFTSREMSCIHITEKNGKLKIVSCVQCGICGKACEAGAIKQNPKGVYMIDAKACTGCGACFDACPFGVMVKAEGTAAPGKCIACGICVKQCPQNVLYIKESA
jgi:Fe-S-cluster-containing hydrogenase component 2